MNGRRETIKYVDAPVAPGKSHTFRMDFQDTRITGAANARVRTKAGSMSLFDDFIYEGKARK